MRTEFGYRRTSCGCAECRTNCRFMPGMLIPSDLTRMIPQNVDPFAWALDNLAASPGAIASKGGEKFRIHTLVPATKKDGSCKNLIGVKCSIHAVSPFGCAFFDCGSMEFDSDLSRKGLLTIIRAWETGALYAQIWAYLAYMGKTQLGPEILRERVRESYENHLRDSAAGLVNINSGSGPTG